MWNDPCNSCDKFVVVYDGRSVFGRRRKHCCLTSGKHNPKNLIFFVITQGRKIYIGSKREESNEKSPAMLLSETKPPLFHLLINAALYYRSHLKSYVD
ncbi:hypothetical protein OS493_024986 [Desmophyllum pertusum]|uniref:Uncharacterized protein n=1 Tax=Desmophyllum pertusum TaxID=174260 RepID=A0A9W9YLG3_9CNID|nr:hypothetical protein OS493_024986 [Desmophyllum pertusum]